MSEYKSSVRNLKEHVSAKYLHTPVIRYRCHLTAAERKSTRYLHVQVAAQGLLQAFYTHKGRGNGLLEVRKMENQRGVFVTLSFTITKDSELTPGFFNTMHMELGKLHARLLTYRRTPKKIECAFMFE